MIQFSDNIFEGDPVDFPVRLKSELQAMEKGALPLHKFTNQGGKVNDADLSASVLSVNENEGHITAKVGIFFIEVVGGCNCDDDPEEVNAYCEMVLRIDRETMTASFVP